jgi:uncharacterized protein (TIGR02271 family)
MPQVAPIASRNQGRADIAVRAPHPAAVGRIHCPNLSVEPFRRCHNVNSVAAAPRPPTLSCAPAISVSLVPGPKPRLSMADQPPARALASAASINPSAGHHVVTADAQELAASERAGYRSWSAWTYYARRYGERGRQFTRSDTAWIVTLASYPASVVERQVGWLGAVLAARGMPRLLLEEHLRFLHEELVAAVPQRASEYAVLLQAAAKLRAERDTSMSGQTIEALETGFRDLLDGEEDDELRAGALIGAAVADEQAGVPRAVDGLLDWLADPVRFSARTTVVGVFHERDDAREAIEALKDDGFAADTISILSPDKRTTESMAEETGTHAGSGAATGLVAGGVLGGVGGWLVGIGALAIPGVGPLIAAGAFATALGGAAIGAGVGAIAGALVGMGVPKEEADYYEGEVKSGRTLVTVRSDGRYDDARRILREHGAYDIETGADAARKQTSRSMNDRQPVETGAADSRQTVQLRDEELQARKTSAETGQVTLGKDVIEERKTLEVPVTREEAYVERRAVNRPADRPIEAGTNQTIEVPIREERVDLEKQPVVYEEVGVGKRQVVENEQVSDTVRREQLRVDREGAVTVSGAGSASTASTARGGTWEEVMPGYRERWQQRVGPSGARWEDYEPGYRYGYELRSRPEYRGRQWADVEPQVERDWTQRNPSTPWERVRDTWDETTRR